MKEDFCSYFPEYWITWKGEIIYIGYMCKEHDDTCSFSNFFMKMWDKRVVGTVTIALIAGIACWVLYPSKMIKRWKD